MESVFFVGFASTLSHPHPRLDVHLYFVFLMFRFEDAIDGLTQVGTGAGVLGWTIGNMFSIAVFNFAGMINGIGIIPCFALQAQISPPPPSSPYFLFLFFSYFYPTG